MAHYCINCGAPLVIRTIEGREYEACRNDDFVLWHDPKVATAVVVVSDGGIMLGRRAIEPGYGLWCLPGGYVNDDEHPAEAAVRECLEEICAAVELTGLIGIYHVAKTTASSIVGVAYRGRLESGANPRPGSEMLEVRVFRPDALPELAFPSHRDVLRRFVDGPGPGAGPSRSEGGPRPPRTR